MRKYPDNITFAWQRSDGDYEIVATLNGETISEDGVWNYLVEQTLSTLHMADTNTEAFNREDVVSVLVPDEGEDWEPINVGADR